MTKRFETPKDWKKFNGYVEIRDPLPLSAVMAWEEAITTAQENKSKTLSAMHYAVLPALIQCVEVWHIEGLPDNLSRDNFPGTPRVASSRLMAWLIDSVMEIYKGEDLEESDPNA